MALNPLPLVGLASSIGGLLRGNKDRKRARANAREQGEIDSQRIALNRERLNTEFRQFAVQRELQGTRDRGQIFARSNESGLASGVSTRLRAINQDNQDREIGNREELLALSNQDLDIQQTQSDFNVRTGVEANENPGLFETVTTLATGSNINAVRSAFGLR